MAGRGRGGAREGGRGSPGRLIFPRARARCGAVAARAPCARRGRRRGPRAPAPPAPPREGRGERGLETRREERRGEGGRRGAPRGHPRGSLRVPHRAGPREGCKAPRPPWGAGDGGRGWTRARPCTGAGWDRWGDTRLGVVARPRRGNRPSWWRSEVTSQSRRSRAAVWLRAPGRPRSEPPAAPAGGPRGHPSAPRDLPALRVRDVKCWPGGRSGHGGAGDKQSHRMHSTLDCHKPLQEKINNMRRAARQLPHRKKNK